MGKEMTLEQAIDYMDGRTCDAAAVRKAQQRRDAIRRRRALTQAERDEKSAAICRHLQELFAGDEFAGVKTVFSYRATWEEANVDAFNTWAQERGICVAYPRSLPGGIMKALVPCGRKDWKQGAYGIWEPAEERSEPVDPEKFDAILVPCVSFDRKGNRCGHGAGCYDRYLPRCREDGKAVLIAFDVQETGALVTEATDVPIRLAVTESGVKRVREPAPEGAKEESMK